MKTAIKFIKDRQNVVFNYFKFVAIGTILTLCLNILIEIVQHPERISL